MAKLRETDRRAKHQFSPGDIVTWKRGSGAGAEGIVLKTEQRAGPLKEYTLQDCWVVFAPREFDLYSAARKYVSAIDAQRDEVIGVRVTNTQINFVKQCPGSWLQGISASEVMLMRFAHIADED